MRRREFIKLIGGAAATWPLAARAQQIDRMRRIGMLMPLAADDPEAQTRFAAFAQGLERLGWTIGRNVRIDPMGRGTAASLNLQRFRVRGLGRSSMSCTKTWMCGISPATTMSCQARLPVVEIVASVGVAVGGIVAEALVELERLIELRDLGARVADGRRVVGSSSRCLPDQRRSRKGALRGNRRNEAGAAVRDSDVAFGLLGGLFGHLPPFSNGSPRRLQPLHDDGCSRIIHCYARHRRLTAMPF
jgi:hypothetical protein